MLGPIVLGTLLPYSWIHLSFGTKCWGTKSIQSAALGKKMCNGAIGLYTLSKNTNGCDREMVVQAGINPGYWTFSTKESAGVLSSIVCITHK